MNKKEIIDFLMENELNEIQEVASEDGFVLRFFYDFDETELGAARAYANDECSEEEESDTWYQEFFLPYLNDLAIDQVGEIIEDLMDEFQIGAQYISYEMDAEQYDYNEFVAVFFPKDQKIEIEDVLDKIEL